MGAVPARPPLAAARRRRLPDRPRAGPRRRGQHRFRLRPHLYSPAGDEHHSGQNRAAPEGGRQAGPAAGPGSARRRHRAAGLLELQQRKRRLSAGRAGHPHRPGRSDHHRRRRQLQGLLPGDGQTGRPHFRAGGPVSGDFIRGCQRQRRGQRGGRGAGAAGRRGPAGT